MAEGSWVGLDVHARSIVAGVLDAGSGELRTLWVSPRCEEAVAWLRELPAPVRVVYEAGPTGYGLARVCGEAGILCMVAAPSKIPRAAGDRVKTDRRDAERLARLLRLGELVPVRVPEPHEEAARDLVRAREDARGDLMRARHRLSKLLLRHELVYEASAWTLAHDGWLRRQRFESRPLALAFDECYSAVLQAKTRRDTLDAAIVELAAEPPFAEVVGRLCCLRGVSTLTALGLTVELGDWARFRPQSLGPFLGLTPSEDSSGERRRLGAITKDRQHARPTAAGRGGLAPASPAARERDTRAPPAGPTGRRPCARRSQRPPPARPLARARRTRQTTHNRRCRRRTRTRRTLLGAGDNGIAQARQRLGEESAAARTTRGATRGTATSSPRRRRSTLESGTTPHLAHPVLRSRPAHISRDTTSTTAAALPPPKKEGPQQRASKPCQLDKAHSISAVARCASSVRRGRVQCCQAPAPTLGRRGGNDES
jgi:transposase